MKGFYTMLLACGCLTLSAQISPEKLAAGKMDKKKWQKTELAIRKALAKDTTSAEARYLLALFFFSLPNPAFDIDSAHRYVTKASRAFEGAAAKERERLRRVPLDSIRLRRLALDIDSAAFEKAKQLNTTISYQSFIDHYTDSRQRPSAIELRDEVAFLDVLKVNTWRSYEEYLRRYPASRRRTEAQERYDKLLFEDKTKDQRLQSFINFHEQYPASPYRAAAEKNIFEMSTASGSVNTYRWFLKHYPSGKYAVVASNILYKLQEADDDPLRMGLMNDSLRHAEVLNRSYWVPVIKSGLFGFIDSDGNEVVTPRYSSLADDYRCGDIVANVLITSEGLVARNGKILWRGKFQSVEELNAGFVMVVSDSVKHVVHESGFVPVHEPMSDARGLANHFIATKKNGRWGVIAFSGFSLLPHAYNDVSAVDTVVLLTKNNKKIISTPYRMASASRHTTFKEDFVVDDFRRWGSQQYWVRNGSLEGVIDANLSFVIPLDRQILRKTSFGFLRGKEGKFYVKGISILENIPYKSVSEQGHWVKMKSVNDRHILYEKVLDITQEGDSAWFQGKLAFLSSGDSVKVFLPSGQKVSFQKNSPIQIREFQDSSAWLVMEERKKKVVIDAASGVKLFTMEFDQIDPAGHELFIVSRGGKKGIVGVDGKIVVPLEFDAIVATDYTTFSVLKDRKFGLYDARSKIFIKPIFERNLRAYNEKLHTAFRETGYAFVHPDGKPLGSFEWEEIQFWNDSTAWVKKNFQWILLDIYSQQRKLDRVRSFQIVKDAAEKIYIVRQDNAFGVISSKKGIIVPIQYSDIVNIGNPDVPLYFTERHIEEAGISVVIYYDRNGKIIRRQALETEEFEKIYCDN